MRSGWITTGPKTKKFETEISSYCGTEKTICLNSATSGLELVLRLFGIGEGDEVITSAYTYTASASVISHIGARIILADTAAGSYEIDCEKLEGLINERTKAIIPVDLAGVICDYEAVLQIVENKRHLFTPRTLLQQKLGRVLILGDAAHSFGSVRNGIVSGAHADFSVFSFHAVKNITTAEGGAVTWKSMNAESDEEIYRQIMLYALHGQTKDAFSKMKTDGWEYDIVAPYYKCNMTDILSSIGLAQLRRYDGLLKRRAEITDLYNSLLDCADFSILRHTGDNFNSCKHLYMIRLNGRDEDFRNRVIVELGKNGIAANVHFKPLPMLSAYKRLGFDIEDFPNAYNQYKNSISLPLHTLLTDDEVCYVAESLLKVARIQNR